MRDSIKKGDSFEQNLKPSLLVTPICPMEAGTSQISPTKSKPTNPDELSS